jgi:hypothetical protein
MLSATRPAVRTLRDARSRGVRCIAPASGASGPVRLRMQIGEVEAQPASTYALRVGGRPPFGAARTVRPGADATDGGGAAPDNDRSSVQAPMAVPAGSAFMYSVTALYLAASNCGALGSTWGGGKATGASIATDDARVSSSNFCGVEVYQS